jgi:CD63 antigen
MKIDLKISCQIYNFSYQQISGLGILIAGIVVLNDVDDFRHFLEGRITAPPILLIITGLLIFAIAFLGCYGALKESPKLLMAVSF